MDERFLRIYTRLKLNSNSRITITYYSGSKCFKNQCFKLIDIIGFSHILVNRGQKDINIHFFGPDTSIESITIDGESQPIYFNPYIKKHLSNKNNKENYDIIKKEFFGSDISDEDLEKRGKFILHYSKRRKFELDSLFFSEKQRIDFTNFFEQIVKELTEYAKKHGLDSRLIKVDAGTTSVVYSIGDKVIKIGKPRTYPTIPYCEYLLQPIINREFEFDLIPIHIEISEKVMTKNDDPQFEQKFGWTIDYLRQKLKDIGLKCIDLNLDNIGILMRDNIIHFDSIPFKTGNEIATSIRYNNSLKIRKKGDPVIMDLDALEIEDIYKYCEYLRSIGYDENKIIDIKNFYRGKVKKK